MNTDINEVAPLIEKRARVSKIWFVPILALLVAFGMLLNHWQNLGVSIQLSFETAEGLEAGKTKVKYRSVDIGVVKSITFNTDQSKILVNVIVDKTMRALLKSDSLFWVVRPRVGAAGVSGFGTLVSGAYIEISPGSSGEDQFEYQGLEQPPVTSPTTPGIKLSLKSSVGQSVKIGNPVLHRGFQVGRVETVVFDTVTRTSNYDVFIDAPYDGLVNTNTHFWNVGGASLSTSATGVSVNIGSFETLVSGGLEFDVPEGFELGQPVESGHVFELFSSKDSVLEGRKYRFIPYLVLVEDSIGGLKKGAPVEFRGVRIGTVERARLMLETLADDSSKAQEHRVPVLIKIEPERASLNTRVSLEELKHQIDKLVLNGLTATVETANFLTGGLKISLNTSDSKRQSLEVIDDIAVIPSSAGSIANMTEKIDSILTTIDELPLHAAVTEMNTALTTANQTMVQLQRTMQEADVTLQSVRPQADLFEAMRAALLEFEQTLDRMQPILQEIGNQPNSLIFGNKKPLDREPKAKKMENK